MRECPHPPAFTMRHPLQCRQSGYCIRAGLLGLTSDLTVTWALPSSNILICRHIPMSLSLCLDAPVGFYATLVCRLQSDGPTNAHHVSQPRSTTQRSTLAPRSSASRAVSQQRVVPVRGGAVEGWGEGLNRSLAWPQCDRG